MVLDRSGMLKNPLGTYLQLMSLILEHGQSSLLTTVLDTAACALVVQAAKRHNDDEHVQKNVCWLLSVLADRGGTADVQAVMNAGGKRVCIRGPQVSSCKPACMPAR